jgi:hypothetical protein
MSKVLPKLYTPETDPHGRYPKTPRVKELIALTDMPYGLCRRALEINHNNIEYAIKWLKLAYWKRPETLPLKEDGTVDYSVYDQVGGQRVAK